MRAEAPCLAPYPQNGEPVVQGNGSTATAEAERAPFTQLGRHFFSSTKTEKIYPAGPVLEATENLSAKWRSGRVIKSLQTHLSPRHGRRARSSAPPRTHGPARVITVPRRRDAPRCASNSRVSLTRRRARGPHHARDFELGSSSPSSTCRSLPAQIGHQSDHPRVRAAWREERCPC
jgi:hypothetical protein